jgi:hypothetical protein
VEIERGHCESGGSWGFNGEEGVWKGERGGVKWMVTSRSENKVAKDFLGIYGAAATGNNVRSFPMILLEQPTNAAIVAVWWSG